MKKTPIQPTYSFNSIPMGGAISSALTHIKDLLLISSHKFWPPQQLLLPWRVVKNQINILVVHHPINPDHDTFTYISHRGTAKAFCTGTCIHIHERCTLSISGILHLVYIPTAEGTITNINQILEDL
ncbi:hypothetical protein BDZ94DRAFT_1266248 [Collybia nuda]|uniref:Uncharacterized protein n=1 Tax=Collybia nuda TaxID=64659 RepID=A0A9P6CGZ2_9AGAR|nr:hypothetical protein BDZ94DRAFT_1266248 [Collybia nuda]